MTALPPDVVADLRLENARLVSELRAARDRQTASAEILRTIASTSGDAERALQQIADATAQLFGASSVTLRIASGDEWIRTINVGASAKRISSEVSAAQLRIGGHNLPGTVLRENRQIHVPDINNVDPAIADWPGLPPARAAGTRAMAGTPLRREGKAIGALIVHRDRPVPFTDEELALLQSFADQAVIAIENTRLFNETKEALARQTATSDILRVISQSPTDVQPVFDAIVLTAVRLLRCDMSFVMFCDSAAFWVAAAARPESLFDELTLIKVPIDPSANFPSRAIVEKKALHLPDWSLIDLPEHERHIYETIGINSALYLPLLREGECIGLLTFGGKRAGMFGESEIALAESFRDQALIAIENTRLFNETREALDRQTATAEILKVIASSPSDVQPVFDVIVERAVRLCGGRMGRVYRYDDGVIQMVAGHALSAPGLGKVQQVFPRPATDDTIVGQVMLSRRPYILADIEHDETVPALSRQMIEALGTRSQVTMPMLLAGEPIGAITVGWADPSAYKDQQITLLQTFADQAVIAIENVRLFNETREALERQTATADILKVIASSPSDVQPVFEAIASSANRLIGGYSTSVFSIVDDVVHLSALTPTNPKADAALKASFPRPLSTQPGSEQTRNGEVVAVADIETDPAVPTDLRNVWRMRGFRSLLLVPLVKEQATIGMISVTRKEPGRFAAHHVQLLQTFADQAVIAIENTRLFNETKEALEQQQATSEVLQVIGNSVANTAPVFEKILDGCEKLFATEQLGVSLVRDGQIHVAAWRGSALEAMVATFPKPVEQTVIGRAIQDRRILHVPNAAAMPDMPATVRGVYDRIGDFSIAWAPMLREQRGVGAIVALRQPPKPFSEKELALLQTFADQAVIAIENTRLFNETREALERQTATAEILKVIASSPSDVQPVFEAIATSANRLIGGHSTAVLRFIGDALHLAAFTPTNAAADEALKATFPRPIAEFPPFLLVRDGETVQFADTESEDVPGVNRELARLRGYRSMLFTPLMSGVTQIGLISVTRKEPGKFAEHHIQLVRTFADQAVIAIENVRLFDQVQAKTRDLTEALTYQTGSGNILRVIASSPTDVEPVLKAIVESACELCEADDALATLKDGDDLVFQAQHGSIPVVWERMPINRQWASGRAVVDRKPVHVHDLLATGGEQFPDSQEFARRTNVRTVLSVPLLRENESIGAIVLRRTEVQPFSDKQISLLQTFADQAVIAIGNVRLFEEVQAKTRDLTESLQFQMATSEVLKVISRSPDALQPVLDVIVETSHELCGSDGATIFLLRDGKFHFTAVAGIIPKHLEFLRANPLAIGAKGSVFTRVAEQKRTLHFPNIADDPELLEGATALGGPRALLLVPLMREDQVIGVIVLRQSHLRPFTPRQIQAIEVFADQAVIAISNVNLFEQVQQRTRELSKSLDDLRTAQDRLIQTEKLASLGQLTAGIAHEIKNPLNFVNNFSALSAELTDELNDLLKSAEFSGKMRDEVSELTSMLKDNLEKVVQHGKRADSIVKNMLLHSREGSGEHRPADINALLDESLNLAYHGARAEKREFNVTLQRDFDEMAGTIEVFPQEITRVFLNLISNGFYAVTKRKTENGGTGFDPILRATTRNLGDTVEIRIRDNGTGIPAEVKEKMFNPFFTTKPAGEGTGLGLSMSHDIIVKQHGGTIDVETEPGQFTEFTIVLPRTSNLQEKKRGQT